MKKANKRVIPGFGLSMGVTISILSVMVLIPLASLVVFTLHMDLGEIINTITKKRVLASFEVSFLTALIASAINPLAGKDVVSFEELQDYPCLSFEQGDNNALYLAEEVLTTSEYKQIIKADDRATLLNLMVGLNGYTLCSGIICEELNGNEYAAVPLDTDEIMTIGYIKHKRMPLSILGEQYIEEVKKYSERIL